MDGDHVNSSTENPLILTDEENKILELYDQLSVLQLEIALLEANNTLPGEPASVSELEICAAQDALLKAKSTFQIRCKVAESVMIADPVIRAVHVGGDASIHQQGLLSLLKKRDELSLSLIQLSKRESESLKKLRRLETENMILARMNTDLTSTMLCLAETACSTTSEDNEPSQSLQGELDKIELDLRLSRQKWKTMKAIVSGAIVGSGVDWARDPKLLQVVLEED